MPKRLLTMLVTGCVMFPAIATAGSGAQDGPWWRNPDWLAAIGQFLGALFTAMAALLAYRAIEATRVATKSQTQGQTVASLLTRYADSDMYVALQGFGRFMGDRVTKEDREEIAKAVRRPQEGYRTVRQRYISVFGSDGEPVPALKRVLARLGYPKKGLLLIGADGSRTLPQPEPDEKELIAHRRTIHHHFKLVWAAWHAGVLAPEHLWLVTTANFGYELWLTAALPVTIGMADAERRPSSKQRTGGWDVEWPWELIRAVEGAGSPCFSQ
jgi:hypothetical protein